MFNSPFYFMHKLNLIHTQIYSLAHPLKPLSKEASTHKQTCKTVVRKKRRKEHSFGLRIKDHGACVPKQQTGEEGMPTTCNLILNHHTLSVPSPTGSSRVICLGDPHYFSPDIFKRHTLCVVHSATWTENYSMQNTPCQILMYYLLSGNYK